MTDFRKKIILTVLCTLIGLIIYLSFKLRNDEEKEILKNNYSVIGVISNVGMKTIDVVYTINNQTYRYTCNKPYSGITSGEEFYTLAGKSDLSRAIVYYSKPVIDTIKYKFAIVSPLDIDKLFIDASEIAFSYRVGNTEYDRIQKYDDGKRPGNVKKLKVIYRIDKPEIGYLTEIN